MNDLWHCEYCGHQQNSAARKCADCGGPRAIKSGDTNLLPSYISLDEYQEYLTGERIKAQNALADALAEACSAMGRAFLPVLENFHA